MLQKRFLTILAVFAILLSISAYAQYETLTGIAADSPEYNEYKVCVDFCDQCEAGCKTNTYRRAAETQNKEEFCNYLPEAEKQGCKERIYMTKAIIEKNSAECKKITDEMQKNGCLLNVQTEKAIAAENEAECNSLEPDFAEGCRQAFYSRMGSLKSDSGYCDRITNEISKEICRSSISIAPAENDKAVETSAKEPAGISKSLIIYGIIILGVIAIAVIAIVIIKKAGEKKPVQAPLMVQQQQNAPQTAQQGEKR